MPHDLELLGRQSSHYTRVARMFAIELGLAPRFTPIFDLMSTDAAVFAGNPTLKLPILRIDSESVFGTLNICRTLARLADREGDVFWPEEADTPLLLNAHEILASAMAAQVEVVMHERVAKRPPDAVSTKRRQGLIASMLWLDAQLDAVLATLPDRPIRNFEIGLFCLFTHFPFRNPVDLSAAKRLAGHAETFGQRASAQATPYRFDS
jgi:hypothetical protein